MIYELMRCFAAYQFSTHKLKPLIFHGESPAAMIYELMRCFAAYQFSTHEQVVIFQGKSLLAHVWAGHKYKPFIVQARTGFVFMTLISYQKKEKDNSKTASFSFRKTMSFYF